MILSTFCLTGCKSRTDRNKSAGLRLIQINKYKMKKQVIKCINKQDKEGSPSFSQKDAQTHRGFRWKLDQPEGFGNKIEVQKEVERTLKGSTDTQPLHITELQQA